MYTNKIHVFPQTLLTFL